MDSRVRSRLVSFYVSGIACGAVVALVMAGHGEPWDWSSRFSNGLIALLGVAVAAEMSFVSMRIGTATLSVAFIPFLAAIFLLGPFWAMVVAGATFFATDLLVRRKPWIKVVFNGSKEMLSLGFAASVYRIFGGSPSLYQFEFVPIAVLLSAAAYAAASSIAVSFVVSLSEDVGFTAAWGRLFGGSALYDLFVTPVPALLAYMYVRWELGGIVALVAPLFIVRHVYVQNLRLQQASRELLELMVKQIEARDPYTSGHSLRVSQYARLLAKEVGVGARQVEQIATAALLHDVGKVYEEYASLLHKEGRLTPDEKALLQTHPVKSAELVTTISSLRGPIESAVRHHHENFDGTGYPDGLAGDAIPLGARIIMAADTLDAMTTDRPYRKALPFERALEEIRKFSGKQFDPRIADIVIRSTALRRLAAKAAPSALASKPSAFERASSRRAERPTLEHSVPIS